MTTLSQIQEFLSHKRLAMVGVSRDPKDFSRGLFTELKRRQYDAIPVNPQCNEVDGVPCYARVGEIQPPVEAALLMTAAAHSEDVVRQCHEAGIRKIWLYRAVGAGAVSEAALEFCRSHEMSVVAGECPFMFLPESAWFHRLHGVCRKLLGSYPTPA